MKIDKSDRRWFFSLLLVVVFITTLPYFVALSKQGTDWVFSGFFIGVEDGNSYLAKMLSGMAGSWLFKTPYTTQPQNGIIAFLPYLLLGKLVHPPAQHIQLIMLFQVFRWVGDFHLHVGYLSDLFAYSWLKQNFDFLHSFLQHSAGAWGGCYHFLV